ncbi:MAG: cytochrome c biogenesis CcdA family protein [Candidatus Ratteibacteria bacterium]
MIKNYSTIFSFLAGIGSFFSPCILPLIPVYISYITGYSFEELKNTERLSYKKILSSSLSFVFGFTFVFILLGASSTFLGNLIGTRKNIMRYVGGALIILFGIHILGIIKIKKLYQEKRLKFKKFNISILNSFIVGFGLATSWTPCVGPVLSSILILSSMEETLKRGILLLFFYSIGMGIPFILISIFINRIISFLNKVKIHTRKFEIFIGFLLIASGIFLILRK